MSYLALARKWRPKILNQVVGQPHVVQILTHALTKNNIHHAYLLTGTHGTGKTSTARIFAKCLSCKTGITATPCETCSHCKEIDAGCFPDLYEIDAASRTKVEDTRAFLENIPYAPTSGRFKIYLIDEVHMLSSHSFNALLKTLEEPPEHVKFLLATTEPQKLPATVLSRCLQFHLSKITAEQIENQLAFILNAEKISFEIGAIKMISESAQGSMRDALSLLDQCIAFCGGTVKTADTQTMLGLANHADIIALLQAVHAEDADTALSLTSRFEKTGIRFSQCLSLLLTELYRISILQSLTENASRHSALKKLAQEIPRETVLHYYQIALSGQRDLSLAPTPQIGFEMIVIRMIASTTKTEVKKTNAKTEIENDWSALLKKLNLTGPTLALAQQCNLKTKTDHAVQLSLHPKYAALNNLRQTQRIQDALTQLHKHPMTVSICIEESAMETPAEIAARLQVAEKQSAKNNMAADATVKRIVEKFDATLMEDSIESNR